MSSIDSRRRSRTLYSRAALPLGALLCALPALARAAEDGLELMPDPIRLAVSFTVLLVLIYPVHQLLLKPLTAVLVRRSEQIQGAMAQAERGSTEARDLEDSIRARLAEARAQGQATRAELMARAEASERDILGRAREAAAESIDRMRARIADETQAARDALPRLSQDLAQEAAAKLLGRAIS